MRFLFIDSNYPGFLASVYRAVPGLAEEPYERQLAAIRSGLFGEAQFQAAALRKLGHEADVLIVNAHPAQEAWAQEHGVRIKARRSSWTFRRRRALLPWPSRRSRDPSWEIVLAQARDYHPDVVYIEIMDGIPAEVARSLLSLARYSIAQIAAPFSKEAFRGYDLFLSSIPDFVEELRRAGADAVYLPLAFEPTVLEEVGLQPRDVPVSFVGSMGPSHPFRATVVERVARASGLDVWTEAAGQLNRELPIRRHKPAYGRAMYEVLGRSLVTLNAHAPWAGLDANNLRLYEATGLGALLVTDARRNLGDLFAVGMEVVAYRTPDEAAELVRHFAAHPDEAARIAAAGQARTLREHTWLNRMSAVVALVSGKISASHT